MKVVYLMLIIVCILQISCTQTIDKTLDDIRVPEPIIYNGNGIVNRLTAYCIYVDKNVYRLKFGFADKNNPEDNLYGVCVGDTISYQTKTYSNGSIDFEFLTVNGYKVTPRWLIK